MEARTKRGIAVLRRVRDFLVARSVTVVMGTLPRHVEALTGIIDRLTAHGVEQDARSRAARAHTLRKRQLVRALRREVLRPIAESAGSVFPEDKVMQEALGMPPFLDAERLVAATYAIADRVVEHKDRFVAEGFVPDFIDKLRSAADAVRTSIDSRAVDVGRRSAATAGLQSEFARGRRIVRLLDAMVSPRLADTPDLLAEWQTLTRFTRVAVAVAEEPTTPSPTPAPAPEGQDPAQGIAA
jgi:hypothetical protein